MKCENCGSKINENDKFCQNCGMNLSNPRVRPLQEKYLENPSFDNENNDISDDDSKELSETKKSHSKGVIMLLLIFTLVIGFAVGTIIFSGNGQLIPNIPSFNKTTAPNTTINQAQQNQTETTQTQINPQQNQTETTQTQINPQQNQTEISG
jgi:zinc-ribbon domain